MSDKRTKCTECDGRGTIAYSLCERCQGKGDVEPKATNPYIGRKCFRTGR